MSQSDVTIFHSRRVEWKLKNQVMKLVVDAGGVVFGGAVRDKYLHDAHADAFYEKCGEYAECDACIQEKYDDHSFLPELRGRWVMPSDIDATIHTSRVDTLLRSFASAFGRVRKIFDRDPKDYLPGLDVGEGALRHVKLELTPFRPANARAVHRALKTNVPRAVIDEFPEIQAMIDLMTEKAKAVRPIMVDLMVSMVPTSERQPIAPFGNIDFMCNALLMDKGGISLSPQFMPGLSVTKRLQMLARICKQIEDGKAVGAGPLEWYRVRKMMDRGWKTVGCFNHIRTVKETNYNGHCIICHDELQDKEGEDYHPPFHMKLSCCDARYHIGCLVDAIEKGENAMENTLECIMCKKNVLAIGRDCALLNAVYEIGNVEVLEDMGAPRAM